MPSGLRIAKVASPRRTAFGTVEHLHGGGSESAQSPAASSRTPGRSAQRRRRAPVMPDSARRRLGAPRPAERAGYGGVRSARYRRSLIHRAMVARRSRSSICSFHLGFGDAAAHRSSVVPLCSAGAGPLRSATRTHAAGPPRSLKGARFEGIRPAARSRYEPRAMIMNHGSAEARGSRRAILQRLA